MIYVDGLSVHFPKTYRAILCVLVYILIESCSGVSRILFRGGGFKIFWKNGGICMALRAMQRVAKPRVCYGGSGACSPEKILKNDAIWCVLESILLKFCQKNNFKNKHFLYKNNR